MLDTCDEVDESDYDTFRVHLTEEAVLSEDAGSPPDDSVAKQAPEVGDFDALCAIGLDSLINY
jgi:hypothetical protein